MMTSSEAIKTILDSSMSDWIPTGKTWTKETGTGELYRIRLLKDEVVLDSRAEDLWIKIASGKYGELDPKLGSRGALVIALKMTLTGKERRLMLTR